MASDKAKQSWIDALLSKLRGDSQEKLASREISQKALDAAAKGTPMGTTGDRQPESKSSKKTIAQSAVNALSVGGMAIPAGALATPTKGQSAGIAPAAAPSSTFSVVPPKQDPADVIPWTNGPVEAPAPDPYAQRQAQFQAAYDAYYKAATDNVNSQVAAAVKGIQGQYAAQLAASNEGYDQYAGKARDSLTGLASILGDHTHIDQDYQNAIDATNASAASNQSIIGGAYDAANTSDLAALRAAGIEGSAANSALAGNSVGDQKAAATSLSSQLNQNATNYLTQGRTNADEYAHNLSGGINTAATTAYNDALLEKARQAAAINAAQSAAVSNAQSQGASALSSAVAAAANAAKDQVGGVGDITDMLSAQNLAGHYAAQDLAAGDANSLNASKAYQSALQAWINSQTSTDKTTGKKTGPSAKSISAEQKQLAALYGQ